MNLHSQFDIAVENEDLEALKTNEDAQSFLRLKPGDISPDGSVIVGEDGYLFIYDGSNHWRRQLSGEEIIADESLQNSVELLHDYRNEALRLGIDFQVVVVPEKDVICAPLSPNASEGLAELRSVHRLQQALNFPLVYPYAEMRAAAEEYRLYHRRDSHYSFFGGLYVANGLLAALGEPLLNVDDIEVEHVPCQDDLSLKWAQFPVRRRQIKRNYVEAELNKVEGHMGLHLSFQNPSLEDDRTLIIFGDSYTWNPDAGLGRFMTLRFKTVHFVWIKRIDWKLVEALSPHAIIIETAERFLIRGI